MQKRSKITEAVIRELQSSGFTKTLKQVPLDCMPRCLGGIKPDCQYCDFVIVPGKLQSEESFGDFLIVKQ